MLNTRYDVIIVGGGPAGTTAGRYLAQQGMAVVLLDKAAFPRAKPCGGGLTYRILERFPDIRPEIEACVVNRVATIHFYAPDRSCVRYTYPEPIALMIQRREFDAMLLKQYLQAGGKFAAPVRVVDVTVSEKYVDVCTSSGETFRGKVVIGADGAHSVIARRSGLRTKWQRHQLMVSVFSEIPAALLENPDQSIVHTVFGVSGFGYGWLFPKHERLNVGIAGLLSANATHRMTAVYREFLTILQQQGILSPALQIGNLRGGIIPIQGAMTHTYRDRVLLCGDAAGFVHGITGEGIYYAMSSGAIAAQTVRQACEQHDFGEATLANYEKLWQHDIGQEIAESVQIQKRLIQAPNLVNTLVRTVGTHDAMSKMFTDYFMGKTHYPELKGALMRHFLPQYLKLQALKAIYTVLGKR